MSYLLRRTKKARAGWVDALTGRVENPVQKPWAPWGNPRSVELNGSGMVFGNDGGWAQPNPNGGVGYEHMPLTPNWSVQFSRTLSAYASDSSFRVYLDRNWTAGGSAGSTQFQTFIELLRETEDEERDDGSTRRVTKRRVLVTQRDTSAWFSFGGVAFSTLSVDEWQTKLTITARVFRDRVLIVYINGERRIFLDITDSRYNFGGGQRSANFAQISGPTVTVSDFATRDIPGLRETWIQHFYDDFNRSNTTTVGNGWTNAGSDYGINNGALSMMGGFPGDGYRYALRGPAPSRNQRVEVTFGGGTGDPAITAAAFVVLRANSGLTSGLAFRLRRNNLSLMRLSGSPTSSSSYTELLLQSTPYELANGMQLAFHVDGDYAWVDRIDGGRRDCLFWTDGIDGQVGDQRHYGAVHQRLAFANSVPFNDYRVFNAA